MSSFRQNCLLKNPLDCFFLSLRFFCLTSSRIVPSNLGIFFNVVIVTSYINSMMLSTYYNAGFTSILAFPRYTKSISTIEEMLDANINWGEPDKYILDFLADYNNSKTNKLMNRFNLETNLTNRNDQLEKGNYGFVVKNIENIYVTDLIDSEFVRSKMNVLSDCISTYKIVLPLRKHFPLTSLIKRRVQRVMESGLILHWYKDVQRKFNESFHSNFFKTFGDENFSGKPLDLVKMFGLFYIVGVGFGLAIIIFTVEMLY